jgi:REP element-mobilizing transposase RayT
VPRSPRDEYESGIYHVTARGTRREVIYHDDTDRLRYLAMLGRVTTRMGWLCLSYCQMGNHVHLLIETRSPNLGAGMHRLHGLYAQYFNRRHGYSGHLFGDRFHDEPIESDAHLWMVAAYIARNPVRAGLCAAPIDWPWSSHRSILGRAPVPTWLARDHLLSYFDSAGGRGLNRYTDLVDLVPDKLKPKGDSPL